METQQTRPIDLRVTISDATITPDWLALWRRLLAPVPERRQTLRALSKKKGAGDAS
jgi:hypothetical protein